MRYRGEHQLSRWVYVHLFFFTSNVIIARAKEYGDVLAAYPLCFEKKKIAADGPDFQFYTLPLFILFIFEKRFMWE